jgi:hypothetical protein
LGDEEREREAREADDGSLRLRVRATPYCGDYPGIESYSWYGAAALLS